MCVWGGNDKTLKGQTRRAESNGVGDVIWWGAQVVHTDIEMWPTTLLLCVVGGGGSGYLRSGWAVAMSPSGSSRVQECCDRHGVSDGCNRMLCNPHNPPNDFDVYNMFERKLNCAPYMDAIAGCLADGRDHVHCCVSEAKDRDESACFGMCRGEGVGGVAAWDKYQTCLAINLHPMFKCFELGYANTPSAPLTPQIITVNGVVSTDDAIASEDGTVKLKWSPPTANSHLAESYQVVCTDVENGAIEKTVNTRVLHATLSGLRPDATYSLHVLAITRDGRRRSLPSATLRVHTRGIAPRVNVYREVVSAPRDANSVTLACHTQMSGGARIHWLTANSVKLDNDNGNNNGDDYDVSNKHNVDNYVTERPRQLISTLLIRRLTDADFGVYTCVATNRFGSASAKLRVTVRTATAPTSIPPELPHACCQRLGIRSPCAVVCGTALGKRAALRADAFMSGGCVDEVGKLLTCTVAGIDDGTCCLRRRVPVECMPLCDGSQQQPAQSIPHACAAHTYAIFQCRTENADNRPATVAGLSTTWLSNNQKQDVDGHDDDEDDGHGGLLLRWNVADLADVYHVYWRRRGIWHSATVHGTSKRISYAANLDELVVVASNSFGNAHPARLINSDGRWLPVSQL